MLSKRRRRKIRKKQFKTLRISNLQLTKLLKSSLKRYVEKKRKNYLSSIGSDALLIKKMLMKQPRKPKISKKHSLSNPKLTLTPLSQKKIKLKNRKRQLIASRKRLSMVSQKRLLMLSRKRKSRRKP